MSWSNSSYSSVKDGLGPGEKGAGALMRGNYKGPGKNNEDLILSWRKSSRSARTKGLHGGTRRDSRIKIAHVSSSGK